MGEEGYDTDQLEQKIIGKVAWRLIPFMVLLYFLNYLDRVNVSFAALTMNEDLGFSATVYGNGAGMLFLGYAAFMIPSNLILNRIGARRWIAPITILWGLIASLMAFVQGPVSFYVLRFLLGVAEAGFFPGMILYLTYWFPSAVRGRITSLFLLAIPLSSVLGAPVSTILLDISAWGLKGWQWLFVIQVLAAVALTVAACGIYAVLPVFWTIPTTVLSGTAAAGGIALINMVGNIGGYVGPAFIGYIRDQTQSFSHGFLLIGGFAILSAVLAPMLGHRLSAQAAAPSRARCSR